MEIGRREILDLYQTLRADNSQRNGEYDQARRYYGGELYNAETNPAQKNRYSLHANYLKPLIDKSVQLLVGRVPGCQVMPAGTDELARDQAEQLEGIIYEAWDKNDIGQVLFKLAWDSFVLRRGVLYYWWDPKESQTRFKPCIPDDYYPMYDGDRTYAAIYVHRRLTVALKREYPAYEASIYEDPGMDQAHISGQDQPRVKGDGYTTVIDYYDADGDFTRIAGEATMYQSLGYPIKEVPFLDFPCFPVGGNREPLSGLDQIVELVQYLSVLLSQKADIIGKYSNPPVLDHASGQSAEDIRIALSAPGSIIPMKKDGDLSYLNWNGSTPEIDSMIEKVQDIIFDLSGKPRSAFGQTITNQSGVVTNLTLTPTLQSNEAHETLWGERLSVLNERVLQLTERFAKGTLRTYRGRVPSGANNLGTRYLEVSIDPADIAGWYKNRIRWPSAIRIDDPVYVQNQLSQLTSDPPAISLYTYLENMGVEDVEAEITRIGLELEDPRLHPDRLQAGMQAAGMAQGGTPDQAQMAGVGPAGPQAPAADYGALQASASPYAGQLAPAA